MSSCSSDLASCGSNAASVRSSITNGVTDSTFLGASSAYSSAIVRVSSAAARAAICSGVLVRDRWVLTAAHCTASAVTGVREDGSAVKLTPVGTFVHPELDVALVELAEPMLGPAPWLALAAELSSEWLHEPVQLAGYGATETGTPSEVPRFVVESVRELTERELVVDGDGRSGACGGDSGGPLLARGAGGGVVVLGILVGGAASCFGTDVYARADVAADWVDEIAGGAPAPYAGCAGLTGAGVCRHGHAMFCSSGNAVVDSCEGDMVCGYGEADEGYRCLARGTDPCRGVDDLGDCAGNRARYCESGRLVLQDCGCASTCRRSLESGRVGCFED